MNNSKYPVNDHNQYHAHIYFEQATLDFATELCQKVKETFNLTVGTIHQKPVGPHPRWSCQIKFSSDDFEQLIPWLDKNRNGLTILIHALTDDNLKDHTDYAYWLGDEITLNLSIFKR